MIITRSELQTLLDATAIQVKITRNEFLVLLNCCALAHTTGTESELLAAFDDVQAQEQTGPDSDSDSGVQAEIDNVMRDVRNMVPAATHSCPAKKLGPNDKALIEFFGPDETLPVGCAVKLPRKYISLPDTERQAIAERFNKARATLADMLETYHQTGTLPELPNGLTFREYATNLIDRAICPEN